MNDLEDLLAKFVGAQFDEDMLADILVLAARKFVELEDNG